MPVLVAKGEKQCDTTQPTPASEWATEWIGGMHGQRDSRLGTELENDQKTARDATDLVNLVSLSGSNLQVGDVRASSHCEEIGPLLPAGA